VTVVVLFDNHVTFSLLENVGFITSLYRSDRS
jgi:hypothetical protein